MFNYSLIYFVFLFILLSSCDRVRFYERYSDLSKYEWHYQDSIPFYIQIDDVKSEYDIYFNIRHTGNYGFRNIWIKFHIVAPSTEVNSIRHEFTLSEPSGKWYGQGIGGIYDAQFLIRERFKFNESGEYIIYIQHLMRNDVLKEVMNVGLRVDRLK